MGTASISFRPQSVGLVTEVASPMSSLPRKLDRLGTDIKLSQMMSGSHLCFDVVLSPASSLVLADGVDMRDTTGSLTLRRGQSFQAEQPCGALAYTTAADLLGSYHVDCELDEAEFDVLLSAALTGNMPAVITISVDAGESAGDEPMRSRFVWNGDDQPYLDVLDVAFETPLTRHHAPEVPARAPQSVHSAEVSSLANEAVQILHEIRTYARWSLTAVFAIALMVFVYLLNA